MDKACEDHGVPYEPKYPARPSSCLTDDFDQFVAKYATKPSVGVWASDADGDGLSVGGD